MPLSQLQWQRNLEKDFQPQGYLTRQVQNSKMEPILFAMPQLCQEHPL